MQCLLFLLRKTYGFHKTEDWIANSQFVEGTGLRRQHVTRAINELVRKRIVTKIGSYAKPKYRFNKNYRIWQKEPKKVRGTKIGSGGEPNLGHTKESITKDNSIGAATPFLLEDGTEYAPPEKLIAELTVLYPKICIADELKKIRAWCLANPSKRKTRRGASRFLNGWLSRANDKAPKKRECVTEMVTPND